MRGAGDVLGGDGREDGRVAASSSRFSVDNKSPSSVDAPGHSLTARTAAED